MAKNHKNPFAIALLNWHSTVDRQLPWKTSNDPYKIWLSEIIMQQTRIAQGTPYYLKFVDAFPTITDLANAEEDKVMKLWQGLGYYSRARNLHFTAKTVRDDFNGIFPSEYTDILALKGIGKYTAAAIASFAYGEEYPVVDGNVIRLISRYYGISEAVDASETLKKINKIAIELIKGSNPADYNQAIMDFGATMCKPKSPNCSECPLNDNCVALRDNLVLTIPFKAKKIKKKTRHFHYFHITDKDGNTILNQRKEKDIWQSLYDFPLIENQTQEIIVEKDIQLFISSVIGQQIKDISLPIKAHKHVLTHQTIFGLFYRVIIDEFQNISSPFIAVSKDKFDSYALPVLITRHLDELEEWTLF